MKDNTHLELLVRTVVTNSGFHSRRGQCCNIRGGGGGGRVKVYIHLIKHECSSFY